MNDYPNLSLESQSPEERINMLLRLYDLDCYITVQTIKKWIAEIQPGKEFVPLTLICGLASTEYTPDGIADLLTAVIDLYPTQLHSRYTGTVSVEWLKEHFLEEIEKQFNASAWVEEYEQGKENMYEDKPAEALEHFRACIQMMLEEHTTHPDVYRFYANTAIAYFSIGKRYSGKRLLEMSLQINTNYDFAQMTNKRYKNGKFDDVIMLGMLQQGMKGVMKMSKNKNRPYLDTIEQWSDKRIQKELDAVGILVEKKTFCEQVQAYWSVHDFTEAEWYPKYTGSSDQEDMVWMVAQTLWQRWCPNHLAVHFLEEAVLALCEQAVVDASTKRHVQTIDWFANAPDAFFKWWTEEKQATRIFDRLAYVLIFLLYTPHAETARAIAKQFLQHKPNLALQLVELCWSVIERQPWKEQFDAIVKQYEVYDLSPYMHLVPQLRKTAQYAEAEQYLQQAWKKVEQREEAKQYDLPYSTLTIYEDYVGVLDEFEALYTDMRAKEQLKALKKKRKHIEKREDQLAQSERFQEGFSELEKTFGKEIEKREMEEFREDPMNIYFEWIIAQNVQFATPQRTHSSLHVIDSPTFDEPYVRKDKKIGRNDPCPCGSEKKYKKCHVNEDTT